MRGSAFLCLAILLVSASLLLLNLQACGGKAPGIIPQDKIQHVVIIVQENRTPDNLFHDPALIAKGADIASSGVNSAGQTIPLTPVPLAITYDLSHQHDAFAAMYDGGKMDGADKVPVFCVPDCPPPNAQFKYVRPSDVRPYFQIAEQYAFGDRMFQTNQGPSFPAHQFILSGTSAPTATSKLFAAENTSGGTGCAAPPGASVMMIDANGNESGSMYPCFEHPTLTDELNAKHISWRYYAPNANSIWTAPNAIQHMCGPNAAPPNATACVGSDWVNNVVLRPTQILTDIANHQLPSVSWVIPIGKNSDHPGGTIDEGPSWVASVVNRIGASSYWPNTVIIITWDDWGGWYDHVPPPAIIQDGGWGSGYVYGFRVPLIVVSPYTKPGYISHATHDFGSILNFTEQVFGLDSLGYADARADNLADCFNFIQAPLVFRKIEAPLSAEHFLNDHEPATDPDTD